MPKISKLKNQVFENINQYNREISEVLMETDETCARSDSCIFLLLFVSTNLFNSFK
jgi:hypothetical protein